MDKSIEILCAVTCTYENKKLAIICPVGKIIDSLENFNPEYLANRFSGDVNKAYSIDSLVEIEQMIAPIVNRFGKIPDRSYATIAGIRNVETGEDMPHLKNKIDELYNIEQELEDCGYNTYGVFYIEHNIEEFTDENDIPFSEDRALMKVSCADYNLEGLINEVRENYISDIPTSTIPILFNECFIDQEYYNIIGKDRILNMKDINNFFSNVQEGSLYIPFARKDIYDTLSLANGEKIKLNSINTGEMEFDKNNEYGISVDLIDNKYIFNQVEYVFHENNKKYSISILEESEDLTNKIIYIIEKFKK
ncbi:hypothetical protein [Clostridium gasigenes]|uniref:Uncharacterized protein n=1 Tax=Clostridium gasigenes TaxID=94869 RepID=A0A1H0NG70_9CLOT|nr:hypothetical protein [Clostridium gasigenes]SDO91608.1 hypothetical protein SAMN04488529_101817 [Clostridium gasigenes]